MNRFKVFYLIYYISTYTVYEPNSKEFKYLYKTALQEGNHLDLLATSGEYLRLYQIGEQSKSVSLKSKLVNVSEFTRKNYLAY